MRRVGPELLTYFLCFKLLKLLSCLDWGGGGRQEAWCEAITRE